jgi:8-oxo-dGTP diphosphatase
MANTDPLQVVALALFNPVKNRYLIVRRGPDQSGAGHWEFPGGKIEPGESHTQALVREIEEELGIKMDEKKLTFIHQNLHHYPQKAVELYLYKYESTDENFILIEHDMHAWVKPQEMFNYDLAPADIPFIVYL